jgi:protoheme IX farnesyltransferase
MIKEYYALIKSGLIFGNLITVIGGFLLAAHGEIDGAHFAGALVGMFFVIASGCVFNNYIDRDIDGAMERTKDRVLVVHRISNRAALIYGTCLGAIGFVVLVLYANVLAAAVAAVGFFFYVFMYSMWFKRRSAWGTVIGSIAGATPPVVGYCAASNRLDGGAIILFSILVLWQIPHFYAIAIYRFNDYVAANIPVLPVTRGIRATKITMFLTVIAFAFVAPLLTVFGYAGYPYLTIALVLSFAWLALCIQGLIFVNGGAAADARWARNMFFLSLIVMVALFATIAIGGLVKAA